MDTSDIAPARPAQMARRRTRRTLPGFGLTLGYTLTWLSLIVLLPLSALFLKAAGLGLSGLWQVWSDPRVMTALGLSFGASMIAALFNAVAGTLVAWVLVRYTFPGRRLLDAMIDLPFALPTAVAGIALTALYSPKGWIGQWLAALGLKIVYTPLGIVLALIFIGLPFVVRSVQPMLVEAAAELEEAAATLGASRWRTVTQVILPTLLPSILTGFALAFARAVSEYGSVIFIAGNIPKVSEIAPLLIVIKLDEFDYPGAVAIAVAMLLLSFVLLLVINALQAWTSRHQASGH